MWIFTHTLLMSFMDTRTSSTVCSRSKSKSPAMRCQRSAHIFKHIWKTHWVTYKNSQPISPITVHRWWHRLRHHPRMSSWIFCLVHPPTWSSIHRKPSWKWMQCAFYSTIFSAIWIRKYSVCSSSAHWRWVDSPTGPKHSNGNSKLIWFNFVGSSHA